MSPRLRSTQQELCREEQKQPKLLSSATENYCFIQQATIAAHVLFNQISISNMLSSLTTVKQQWLLIFL